MSEVVNTIPTVPKILLEIAKWLKEYNIKF